MLQSSEVLDLMRAANEEFRKLFGAPEPRAVDPGVTAAAPSLAALSAVTESVRKVGAAVAANPLPGDLDESSKAMVAEYATGLVRLKALLESSAPGLERRRDELQDRLAKLQAALRWATSLKETR